MSVTSVLIDHPRTATATIVVVVISHAAVAKLTTGVVPTFAFSLRNSDGVASLYLGAAGVVAMVGGFAGIVVVFAMTQGLKRFAIMRVQGGESLEANWIHPISISLVSAFLLLIASYCATIGSATAGTWLFELSLLLALHGSARLVWLLGRLIKAVRLQDKEDLRPSATAEQAIPRMQEAS